MVCKRLFLGRGRQAYCGYCELWINCSYCGKEFIVVFDKLKMVLENPDKARCCSRRCFRLKENKPIKCTIHGYQKFSISGKCQVCHHKQIHKSIICEIHGIKKKSFSGKCLHCNSMKVNSSISCGIHGYQNSSFSGKCAICHHLNMKNPIKCNIHGYQQKTVGSKCAQCVHFSINCDLHGYQKSSFHGKCLLCFNSLKRTFYQGDFCTIHKSGKRIMFENIDHCWMCFQENLQTVSKNFVLLHSDQIIIKLIDYKMKPILEQLLVDKLIYNFVYVKFYMNAHGESTPLVAGKSASKLINTLGSDIKFDYKNKTPSRIFLKEDRKSVV